MRRMRLAEHDTRRLIASAGMIAVLGACAVVAGSALDSAESTGAVVASEPLPAEPAVAFNDVPQTEGAPPLEQAVAEPVSAAPIRVITDGELARGDTLARALRRSNVAQGAIHLVSTQMSKIFDFRRAQPGHSFRLTQDLDGRVMDFRYWTSRTESIHLALEDGQYLARREQVDLKPRVSRIAGVVSSSLYGAMLALGEEPQLANDFTDVFAWDVDFSRGVRSGDEFRVLYERLYYTGRDGAEVYAGPGRILAARYGGAAGEHTAVYFEPEEGRGGYYRPDGSSVERQFLLAPLRYSRISSRFTSARRHPILKVTRPHHGIDYVAKAGSSVWSVADGKVIYRGWAGGFGNLVKVRHVNGYVSYYAHLSRFADGLRVGDPIQQKQVVGYVGQTGLATGPHVCFRIAQNGRYVNPAGLRTPAAKPVPETARGVFFAVRDTLLSELDAGPFVASGEAL